jgi:hypothetical protein
VCNFECTVYIQSNKGIRFWACVYLCCTVYMHSIGQDFPGDPSSARDGAAKDAHPNSVLLPQHTHTHTLLITLCLSVCEECSSVATKPQFRNAFHIICLPLKL